MKAKPEGTTSSILWYFSTSLPRNSIPKLVLASARRDARPKINIAPDVDKFEKNYFAATSVRVRASREKGIPGSRGRFTC